MWTQSGGDSGEFSSFSPAGGAACGTRSGEEERRSGEAGLQIPLVGEKLGKQTGGCEKREEEEEERAGDSPKPPTWDHQRLLRAQPMSAGYGGSIDSGRPMRCGGAGRGDAHCGQRE
ncbi:hypothetical protein VZT92_021600 [Zoarces viviparus]|uniref:Uncharacterized protein n=1 Tax=Zoarces viviparus TaxID=48416 RepID=A0AAW1EB06_ZOAVI